MQTLMQKRITKCTYIYLNVHAEKKKCMYIYLNVHAFFLNVHADINAETHNKIYIHVFIFAQASIVMCTIMVKTTMAVDTRVQTHLLTHLLTRM